MPTAEIIAIGTEILLGEIQDTNTQYLTRRLRDLGVDVYRATVVGDNIQRISAVICECLTRADLVITTGGLGPTVDDPTREAAALAFHTHLEFHPELWGLIKTWFEQRNITPTDNNKKQAYLPSTAMAIPNPVGTAPAFMIRENQKMLVCLPGVPAEMVTIFQESVIPLIESAFPTRTVIKTRVIHTVGLGESRIDEIIADLEEWSNPTIGLSAHPGIVDICITAKANSEVQVEEMIQEVEAVVRDRLQDAIFGVDDCTLWDSITVKLDKIGKSVVIYHYGFSTTLIKQIVQPSQQTIRFVASDSEIHTKEFKNISSTSLFFGVNLMMNDHLVHLELFSEENSNPDVRTFLGARELADLWVINSLLDFIRRKTLISTTER